jgi:hypothetical protein
MANFRYFAQDVQLTAIHHDGSIHSTAKHFTGVTPDGRRVQVERAIDRKRNASNHKCDARCLNATGFRCECECGGKNHGAGAFICEKVAA